MRTKKPAPAGRRSGIKVRKNIRKNPDGTDVFKDYFETTVEETTVLGTESELQDTATNYDIQYTGVSLEYDTSNTNQYSLMTLRSPLKNSRKNAQNPGKKVQRRKVGRPRKISRSLAQEKTYVDKSVITSPASFTRASLALSRFGLNQSSESLNLRSMNINSPSTSIPERIGPERKDRRSNSKSKIGLESLETSKTIRLKKSSTSSSKSLSEEPLQNHDSKSSKSYGKKSTSLISSTESSFLKQPNEVSHNKSAENISSLTHQSDSRSRPGLKQLDSSKTGRSTSTSISLSKITMKNTGNREGSNETFTNTQEKYHDSDSFAQLLPSDKRSKRSANKPVEKEASLILKSTSKSGTDLENLDSSRTLRSGRIYTPTSKSFTDKNVSKSSLLKSRENPKPLLSPDKVVNPESGQQRDLSNQEKAAEEPIIASSPSKRTSTSEGRNEYSSSDIRFRGINEQNSDILQMNIVKGNKTFSTRINSSLLNSSITSHEQIMKESEQMIDDSLPESISRSPNKSRTELNTSKLHTYKNIQPTTSEDLVQEVTNQDNIDFEYLKKSHQVSGSSKGKRSSSPRTKSPANNEKNPKGCKQKKEQVNSIENLDSIGSDSCGETPEQNTSHLSPESKGHGQKRKALQAGSNLNSRCNEGNQDKIISKSRDSISSFQNNPSVENSCEDIDDFHELDNTREVPIAKPNETFYLNQSKSGKRDSSYQVDNRLQNSEVLTPHKIVMTENEQFNYISLLQSQAGRANTPLDLGSSKSMQHLRSFICRDDQHTSPNANSETLVQNVIGRDVRNSSVLKKSQVKRKRRSSHPSTEHIDRSRSVDRDGDIVQPNSQPFQIVSNHNNSLSHPGTSGHNASNHLPKPKKRGRRRKKSKVRDKTPSPTPYARERPKRSRIPPLAYWKGEHRTFRYTKEGEIILAETYLVNDPSMRIPQKKKRKAKKQEKADSVISDQEPVLFLDEASGNEIELLTCFRKLEWEAGTSVASNPSYKIARSDPEKSSTGYLEFDVNGSKEKQYSPVSNLRFIVLEGAVQFEVADNIIKVGRKDSILIPSRTPYSIKNCLERKSLLYFISCEGH